MLTFTVVGQVAEYVMAPVFAWQEQTLLYFSMPLAAKSCSYICFCNTSTTNTVLQLLVLKGNTNEWNQKTPCVCARVPWIVDACHSTLWSRKLCNILHLCFQFCIIPAGHILSASLFSPVTKWRSHPQKCLLLFVSMTQCNGPNQMFEFCHI